jgi:hypothetical protein
MAFMSTFLNHFVGAWKLTVGFNRAKKAFINKIKIQTPTNNKPA